MEINKRNDESGKRTRRQNQLRRLGLVIAGFAFCCGLIFAKVNSPGKATADEGKWDLSQVYLSLDAWRADLPELAKAAARADQFKGRLGTAPEVLGEFMKARDAVAIKAARLYTYVNLLLYRDMRNSECRAAGQELQNRIAKVDNDLAWIDAELIGIGREKLLNWCKTIPGLRPYQHFFIDLLRQQEHILPEERQKLIGILSRPLAAAKSIYSSLAVADFQPEKVNLTDGREISATVAEMEKFLAIPSDQDDRKKVATAALAPFIRNKTTYAEIFKGIMEARWALAQVYGFASCLEQTLDRDDIPRDVYMNLVETSRNGVVPLQEYMRLRRKVLGLNEFSKADQYVTLVDFKRTYSYEEAASLVAQALAPLGKDYGDQVRRAFSEGWIDVFPAAGKWGGASAIDVYGVHPYVLLNFSGTRNNLFTLVHELGHAMHSVLADASQPFINHEYSSFVAEVAAIFNEHLLLDFLVEHSRDPRERIDLLDQAIQNLIRKFYGSARRAEFEYQAYSLVEQKKPVTAEILAELYNGLEKQYLGDTVAMTASDPERYSWPVISHFFTHYYYVFQYATSYAASVNLFQQLEQAPGRAAKKRVRENYLALLRSGGNGYPIDQLRAAGIDLTVKAPFQAVVNEMSRLVDRLERELQALQGVGVQNHQESTKKKLANRIQQYLTHGYADSILNGVVFVSVDNEIISEGAWGYQNINLKTKNSVNTIFNLASITKPFTATAIYILQAEKKLNIKNPVKQYIPVFPYPKITIENLLTHTSGLPDYTHSGPLTIKLRQSGRKSMTNNDIVEWYVNDRPDLEFQSGTESRYCNANYVLLAQIIESTSGMSYKKFIQDKIFDKLDMKDSFVITPADAIDRSRFAIGYRNSLYGDSQVEHTTSHDGFYDEILGDGGIFMAAGDLNKLSYELHYGRLKDAIPESAFQAFTLSNGEKGKYASGWFVGENKNKRYIKHGGSWGGYLLNFYRIPDDNINIIILTNNTMSPYSMDDLTDGIIDILSGNTPKTVRQPISRILPRILSSQGAGAALKEYNYLKQTAKDRYMFFAKDLFGLGITLFYNNDFENAAVIFKLTADEYPDYLDTYEYLADAYQELKKPELAAKYYQRAIEANPGKRESIQKKITSLKVEKKHNYKR